MKQILTGWRLWLPAVLIALLAMPGAFAQETTAGVVGTVKDSSGAVVTGANVEVTSPALIGSRKVQTDAAGTYRIAALPPGVYTMTITATGFRTHRGQGIELSAGRLPSIDVTLEVGALTEMVEVTGTSTAVDVTQSKVAVTVDRQILSNLPTGRSFQSLIPFAPGARAEPMQGGRYGGRDNGFQIDGASDSENVYLIDGVNTTNIQNGGVGQDFKMEFIEEVQIKSSSFEAEFGGALGGVINAVPKRGGNDWHGSLLTYWRTNALNGRDSCSNGMAAGSTNYVVYTGGTPGLSCGLRLDPTKAGLNTTLRLDGTPQYYDPKKDQRNIIEPGYQIGGALLKDRLWIFSSYIPSLDAIHRSVNFTGSNPGPRTLSQTTTTQNAYNRLDFKALNSLRLFGAWNYGYSRTAGQLVDPDSYSGLVNGTASTDPNTLRSDFGAVTPLSVWSFGGDWTPTSRLVVTGRFGYFFTNYEQRGIPSGTRRIYDTTLNPSTKDLAGNTFPSNAPFNTSGYANIPSNLATSYDAYKRKSFNFDASYFVSHLGGTHTFKGGYFWQHQSEDVLTLFNGGVVNIDWGLSYQPQTSTTVCDSIKAANLAAFGQSVCGGRYGYYFVGSTTTTNTGGTTQTAQALYIQDAWNVGHGLTLNLGIRFDTENMPPYDPVRFPSVKFGWDQKVAPRIGGAYDLLHNGKVKVYASYGKFYDIMKMGLARGSFGSDFWHECVYTLDSLDVSSITPTAPIGGGCPGGGTTVPAPGNMPGRFIENVDYRATKADPRDPAIQPDMKPMAQHEYVTGVDWSINNNWTLEGRYSRKRLDNAIEDMAITDSLGFYIGNPGSQFSNVLHRPVVTPNDNGVDYLTSVPFCAECPNQVNPIRRYDGMELRLSRRPTGKWYGAVSYAYSKLRGNYAGLTNTDITDGNGGRHSPNNGRAFDLPTMSYDPSGQVSDGPLATDRPHTGKVFLYYTQKSKLGSTQIGWIQTAYQGSPLSTCLPVVGTSSACQWAEGRGNFVQFHRAANGDIVKDGVDTGARTSPYIQSDVSVRHEIPMKGHENMRLAFEMNVTNLFNQRAATAYYQFAIPTNLISPTRAVSRFSGDPQVDWGKVMNGYNYMDALNGTGTFAGVQSKLTFASRYGQPVLYQTARTIRLAVRFTF